MLESDDIRRARAKWRFTGRERPPFADTPEAGQESVWDYPRPPRIEAVAARLEVEFAGETIASTARGVRVVETASPPVYYFPPQDVVRERLVAEPQQSFCEWKGAASSFAVRNGERISRAAAWSYVDPFPEFAAIAGWIAFNAGRVDACRVGAEVVSPQPGGYYGGWITRNLAGPFKGNPGSESW